MTRPSKQEYFMKLAEVSSERSSCPRANVGVVVVKDGVVLATGYNGSCRGEPSCNEEGCIIESGHCVRSIHAEMNAIINAARIGVPLYGAELYCTHKPCNICSRIIVNSGILKVFYKNEYGKTQNIDLEKYIEVKKI